MSDEEVSSESNPRYSISNGRFTIVKPDRVIDAGVYTCEASNKFGTVLSNPVELIYGYLGQFSNVKPSTVDAVLYMGIDLNCPIPLHNTGLSYNWYKADVQFLRPEFNPQYFLSRNGHLYISEVQASD
uniref:Ig-like domain-containing protein n=1 Tax=Biomphalaria glabrata TaxID=6526 RepID=A0A2C9KIY9_BIOGL